MARNDPDAKARGYIGRIEDFLTDKPINPENVILAVDALGVADIQEKTRLYIAIAKAYMAAHERPKTHADAAAARASEAQGRDYFSS